MPTLGLALCARCKQRSRRDEAEYPGKADLKPFRISRGDRIDGSVIEAPVCPGISVDGIVEIVRAPFESCLARHLAPVA
ncbi:hypothetical protein, partial [Methylobacterium sp. WL2]|uniref:hypothetical protein n=1 Tax=Methylobacterium sp. WL2 TaxID=2603902 RepID=UPI001AEDCCC7